MLKRKNPFPVKSKTAFKKARPRPVQNILSTSAFQMPVSHVEKKFFDKTISSSECSTTGTITHINAITQGNDYNNMLGRQTQMKSVSVHGYVAVGATPTSAAIRLLVVYDKSPSGALPAITDILTVASMGGHVNLNNSSRFVILYDRFGELEVTDKSIQNINLYRRIDLPATQKSNDGAIANYVTGAMYLVTVGNLATGVTAPVANVITRIRFVDHQ